MKRWVYILIIIIVCLLILGIIGYLQSTGKIKSFGWQGLSMIFAGLAAPIKMIVNAFKDNDSEVNKILDKQSNTQAQEKIHRQEMDKHVTERRQKIELLDKEIEALDAKLKLLKEKQKNTNQEIDNMDDTQKSNEAKDLWGS